VQNLSLSPIAKTDTQLYTSTAGQYDMWWGGRIGGGQTIGGRNVYVTDKLVFDFLSSERSNLIEEASTGANSVVFQGTEYTHKLPLELRVELPSSSTTHPDLSTNQNIYRDASKHSNNDDVADNYFLFIKRTSGSNDLCVLAPSDPGWT